MAGKQTEQWAIDKLLTVKGLADFLSDVHIKAGKLSIGGTTVTSSAAELNTLVGVTPGTAAASKAAVLGANKNLDTLVLADGGLSLGSGAGTAVGATAAELNTAADLSANGALVRVKKLAITATPTGAEQDTGWDLPDKCLVLDVFVDVTTQETVGTTKTLDVGILSSETGGDTDGLIDGISVAAVGILHPAMSFIAGTNETYVGNTTYGVLMSKFFAGTNVDGDSGVWATFPYASKSGIGKSIVYQAGSNDFTAFRGAIYVTYIELG